MSGYAVFQAYDGRAAQELCARLPNIELLVLNTLGTGIDLGDLIEGARESRPNLPVLHIGNSIPDTLPPDVPTLEENFTPDTLLMVVEGLMADSSLAVPLGRANSIEESHGVPDRS